MYKDIMQTEKLLFTKITYLHHGLLHIVRMNTFIFELIILTQNINANTFY